MTSGSEGQRAVPYYCPFCAGEDLWPAGETHGQWQCRSCTRTFALRFVGLTPVAPAGTQSDQEPAQEREGTR
jgi:ribosomal protein L37AE/L43A